MFHAVQILITRIHVVRQVVLSEVKNLGTAPHGGERDFREIQGWHLRWDPVGLAVLTARARDDVEG